MSNALNVLPGMYLGAMAIQGHGVSDEAGSLRDQWGGIWSHLLESSFLGHGRSDALHELLLLFMECRESDWDGYGAEPAKVDALSEARSFLLALPFGFPAPSLSIDPDGDVDLEWFVSQTRLFSICIAGDGVLRYAGLFGRNEKSGKELYYGEVPDEILSNLRRLYPSRV